VWLVKGKAVDDSLYADAACFRVTRKPEVIPREGLPTTEELTRIAVPYGVFRYLYGLR